MTNPRSMFRSIAVVLLAVWTCGCMTWRTQSEPLRTVLESTPSSVRINTPQGNEIVLTNPQLMNDSVIGFQGSMRMAIATQGITTVQTRSLSVVRTLLATGGGIVALYAILVVYGCSTQVDC